jgi:serine/threonine protein kinase
VSDPSWQAAERWLLAALDQPTEARARFLYEKISDPVLRARVESLVAADARCGTFLEAPAHAMLMPELPAVGMPVSGLAIPDSESAQPLRIPTRIGSYRLVRELGQGGMSVVYLGERIAADFEQRVAVKLLRAGALSDDMRRRFRAERQILAQLEHPAIARLLDGGTTDTGLPYLVMDYVIGLPIDRYCDSKRLDVRARVRCFLEVCAAVRHAHRNLVVHRDIKPSNILVGEDGKPKLLDFGIAKLITAAPDGAAASEVTATCQRMLTPNYASPEQLRGEAITTAWDVYALGVLLYRLLTGSLPHRLEGRTFEAMWRQLQTGHPPIPSAAVVAGSSMEGAHCWQDRHGSRHRGQAGHPVAGSRGSTTTRQLARKLRGDLDTITMTALHRDPDRRYGSVDALIDDLERYQDGRPVWARRDSVLYRAGKFVVRQRLAVAVTLAFVLLTAGFAIDRARSAWQLERERDEKEEVATFLVSLFETQGEGPETEVQARSLLDRGVAQATARLDTQPGVGAS